MRWVAILLLAGCAETIVPYVGPPGPPAIYGRELLWLDLEGKLRRETTLLVTNPGDGELDTVLECSPHGHGHQSRNWPGSRFTIHLPPRSMMPVLLHPRDHLCELQPVEQ